MFLLDVMQVLYSEYYDMASLRVHLACNLFTAIYCQKHVPLSHWSNQINQLIKYCHPWFTLIWSPAVEWSISIPHNSAAVVSTLHNVTNLHSKTCIIDRAVTIISNYMRILWLCHEWWLACHLAVLAIVHTPHHRLALWHWNAPVGGQFVCTLFQYEDSLSQYMESHYKEKMVMRLSYLYNGNPYSGKMEFLYQTAPRRQSGCCRCLGAHYIQHLQLQSWHN